MNENKNILTSMGISDKKADEILKKENEFDYENKIKNYINNFDTDEKLKQSMLKEMATVKKNFLPLFYNGMVKNDLKVQPAKDKFSSFYDSKSKNIFLKEGKGLIHEFGHFLDNYNDDISVHRIDFKDALKNIKIDKIKRVDKKLNNLSIRKENWPQWIKMKTSIGGVLNSLSNGVILDDFNNKNIKDSKILEKVKGHHDSKYYSSDEKRRQQELFAQLLNLYVKDEHNDAYNFIMQEFPDLKRPFESTVKWLVQKYAR